MLYNDSERGDSMQHRMQLDSRFFEKIARGQKTVEMRLFDEKRQKIRVGDEILFSDRADPLRTLRTRVAALHRFPRFAALYSAIPPVLLGYEMTDTPDPADMEVYYSREEQEKYGVVGIEIALENE